MIKYFMDNDRPSLTRGTDHAAGWDVQAALGMSRTLAPGDRWLVPTDLYLEMAPGICAMVCSRSGLAINHGVIVLNAPGIIDADYRGEVKISIINLGKDPHEIHPGDKIAQLLFIPVFPEGYWLQTEMRDGFAPIRVISKDALSLTGRGSGGHGSTGR